MKSSRGKIGGGGGAPIIVFIILCIFVFFLGFFSSSLLLLLSHQVVETDEFSNYEALMPRGHFGDDSLTTIPFQVLSWRPRAVYFPGFATAQECESIIKMAETKLAPSTLALLKGDTEESTKGIRTSSGMFISAHEDKTGILDLIEKKIERATMIPRNHGEVLAATCRR
ncbi:hypothetical protein QVD17_10035 [Tagetes erecta]|uniref:Uncharacterized protein n=1 Tax=Tagetes erecta TaxID=13708 RepID=A0AAD8P5K7_TARER|nr:hypothetical protein QVD17_10035 [Tagetes erecta]